METLDQRSNFKISLPSYFLFTLLRKFIYSVYKILWDSPGMTAAVFGVHLIPLNGVNVYTCTSEQDASFVSTRTLNHLVHCWIQGPTIVSSLYSPLNTVRCTQMINSKKWMVLTFYNANLDNLEYTCSLF